MNCPFCDSILTPCGEPDFSCWKCLHLTNIDTIEFVLKEKGKQPHNHITGTVYNEIMEIEFVYKDFEITYDYENTRLYITKQMIDGDGDEYTDYIYKTVYNPNEPFPLTPQNVERRLAYYLVYN